MVLATYVQRAARFLQTIVDISTAIGDVAYSAITKATPSDPTSGTNDRGEFVSDEEMVASTRRDLHEAIQKHMVAMYGPGVVTDWYVQSEVVTDEDERLMYLALSADSTLWKIRGMAYYGAKLLHQLTA